MKHNLITAPSVEPITQTEVKTVLGITDTESDGLITDLIVAAREYAEEYTGKKFITQIWETYLKEFPEKIELPKDPVQSITSIKYYDTDGIEQTYSSSNYYLDNKGSESRHWVYPAVGTSWPSVQDIANAVTVRHVCGYGDASSDVPQRIKTALHIIVRAWLQGINEQGVHVPTIPVAAKHLLDQFREIRI